MARDKLGDQVKQRRIALGLSVSKAARAADVSRTTWIAVESGTRETQVYNYGSIERVLQWTSGSVEAVLKGGEPTSRTIEPTVPELTADDAEEFDIEVEMIEASNLSRKDKDTLIDEAHKMRERQAKTAARERREQIRTWLRLRGAQPAT
jgi:transcriptional regulator with XRE-family HTH domain